MEPEPQYTKLPVASPYDSSESDQLEVNIQKGTRIIPQTPAFWTQKVMKRQKKLKERDYGKLNNGNVEFWLKDSVLQAQIQRSWQPMKVTINFKEMDEKPDYSRIIELVGTETKENVPWPVPDEKIPHNERKLELLADKIGHPLGTKFTRFWEDLNIRKAIPIWKNPWKNQRIWASVNAPKSSNNDKGQQQKCGGVPISKIPVLPSNTTAENESQDKPNSDKIQVLVEGMEGPNERNWDELTMQQQRELERIRRQKAAEKVGSWILQSRLYDPFAYDSAGNPVQCILMNLL